MSKNTSQNELIYEEDNHSCQQVKKGFSLWENEIYLSI